MSMQGLDSYPDEPDNPGAPYCIRLLRGSLELDFPDRTIEAPRSAGLVGPLILLALSPRRQLSLIDFKAQLHDADNPDLVTTAQIQTPISRLRGAGLPIPPRVYMLDVEPSDVDIVDFDTRAKLFIDRSVSPDRLDDDELPELLELGEGLHAIWQDDPAAAVGNLPKLSDLFARHRIRNRRFGLRFTRLLIRAGERDRAEDILEAYVERYGTDVSFQELEHDLRARPGSGSGPGSGDAYDNGNLVVIPGPVAEGPALAEVRERLALSADKGLAQLAISAHYLDLVHSVDRLGVDTEARSGVAVETPGGASANAAFALARLGHRVATSGIVAKDRAGSLLRQSLEQEGVDLAPMLRVTPSATARTGRCNVFTDPWGRRAVYITAGVNDLYARVLREEPKARARLLEMARDARMVSFSAFTGDAERQLQEEILGELPEDVVVCFDPGYLYTSMGLDRLTAVIRRCDILYVHEQRLRLMVNNSSAAGDPSLHDTYRFFATLDALFRWRSHRSARPLVAVVKRERDPQAADRNDQPDTEYDMITIAIGRNSVDTVVSAQARFAAEPAVHDITGHGDAIAAAIHLGLLNGAPPDECADLAMVMANEVSSEIGSRAGLPRRSTIAAAWARYFPHTELPVWVPRAD